MYCNDRNDYVEKEFLSCSSNDKFGFQVLPIFLTFLFTTYFKRPVFTDRVCDNQRDCYGGEDESLDGNVALATCIPESTTGNGCCSSYLINGEE